VNEDLADALADTRIAYDCIDFSTDIARATAAGGKAELLLMDHNAMAFVLLMWLLSVLIGKVNTNK
jgi:hypothetical protein